MSFKELNQKCRLGQNVIQCDELNNILIQIEGIIEYNDGQPILHPAHMNDYDYENEEYWSQSIQIMGTNKERISLREFDKKQVIAEGFIDTSCIQTHNEIDELNKKSIQKESDEIIVRMATGKCHYVNNRAFFAPKIIIKDE